MNVNIVKVADKVSVEKVPVIAKETDFTGMKTQLLPGYNMKNFSPIKGLSL